MKKKTKKKAILYKVLSFLMIFCMSFLFVGCAGDLPDELKEYEEELGDLGGGEGGSSNDSDNLLLNMYGAKVLYRPDSYDFSGNSGGTEENPNDYYGKYAWVILNALYQTYGIIDDDTIQDAFDFSDQQLEAFRVGEKPYFYDSIRYRVDTYATVTKNKDGNDISPYILVGADTSAGWNWGFGYKTKYNETDISAPITRSPEDDTSTDVFKKYDSKIAFEGNIEQVYEEYDYDNEFAKGTVYQNIYLGTGEPTDTANYSDYVVALEYAIYSYALDIEPMEITVSYKADATGAENDPYYSVKVGDFVSDKESSSAEKALVKIKELFNDTGSFVGLTSRQIAKLKTWILNNVIGSVAMESDELTTWEGVKEKVDGNGNVTGYDFSAAKQTSNDDLGRNYQTAVGNIVDGVCSEVTIGNADGEGSGTIEDKYLASEIMEYAGNSFMISGDENFQNVEGEDAKYYIRPQEYQSVALMLKDKTEIDGIYIALKYDADNDGTQEGVWDTSKYLDIIVELNFFSNATGKLYTIGSQQTRVYDGPFDYSHENAPDMYEDMGNVYFYDFFKACPELETDNASLPEEQQFIKYKGKFNEEYKLVVGDFATDIGNSCLMTDVGLIGKYTGAPIISNNPLVIRGTHPARRYYSLLEQAEDEDLGGKTYITGRFNHEKFKGSQGCDYLEITYKVLKNKGDNTTNYKFYTGISLVY